MSFADAIPEFEGDPNSSGVQVLECGERLATLESGGRIWIVPAYHQLGYPTASDRIMLRTGVVEALQRAASSLPPGLSILVWDGLRTLDTQKEIAARFAGTLSQTVPDPVERDAAVRRYVSGLPSSEEEYSLMPPPHTTGAAIDLTLADAYGRPCDLGARFDQFDETAWLTHCETVCRSSNSSPADWERRDLRRILFWAMTRAGFAPYIYEYWHFEFHTRRAAAFHGSPVAAYGPALPFAPPRRIPCN